MITIISLCAPVAIGFRGIHPVIIGGVSIAPGIIISLLPLVISIISLVDITSAVGINIVGSSTCPVVYSRVGTRPGIITRTCTWLSVTRGWWGVAGIFARLAVHIHVSWPVILNT